MTHKPPANPETIEKLALPAWVYETPFFERGGCVLLGSLLGPDVLDALRREAAGMRARAVRHVWTGANTEDWRGGEPARAFWAISGGACQYAIYCGQTMAPLLSEACGFRIQASGAGSYSYYHQPGDFLAVHRDIVRCDATVITCLEETIPCAAGVPGTLRLHPASAFDPLSAVGRKPAGFWVDVPLRPGQTALMLGGVVPHEVTPMIPGQQRTVSVMCYRLD